MTYKKIAAMIASVGLPLTYHHWDKNSAPSLPYIVYQYPERDDFYADDENYQTVTSLTIELYSDKKDFTSERKIESVLKAHGITYEKYEAYISSEEMYEVSYETEVILDGDPDG